MAKNPNQELNFSEMSLDEMEAWEKAEKERQEAFLKAKQDKIQASKQEAFDSLLAVVNKYKLSGADVLKTLIENRKLKFKDIQDTKPIYLVSAKVQKKKKGSDTEMVESDFYYFEGKTILADAKQAQEVCKTIDKFKSCLTEAGKAYLANPDLKHIVVDFYNGYRAKGNPIWNGD
ncbi:MAG TPA: hypothetical protein VF811_11190 [Parasulfuritortus sp.]